MRPLCRKVLVLAFPNAQLLDIAGPVEVFARVAPILGDGSGYSIEVAAPVGKLTTTSGLSIAPFRALNHIGPAELDQIDTLLVSGGAGVFEACEDDALLDLIQNALGRVRRIASICTGSFLLAQAGLLEGRRAATHWSHAKDFRRRHSNVLLDEDALFVRDGDIWTSAGVTAGIDLALAMVRADFGQEVAMTIARDLVMFIVRPGGQAQFSSHLIASRSDGGRTAKAVEHILNHLGADLSVPALAAMLAMSERTFARVFKAELGVTPAVFIEGARVDAARRMLETDRLALAKAVAGACGFRDEEAMRRAFLRQANVTPSQYRMRFSNAMAE